MANITTQTIRVDLSTDKVLPTAFTHQNDTARTLEFSMYNYGTPYTMTGNTVKFAYKSPVVDGQYSVIAGSSMASGTVSGNKVTVTLPSAYTAISGVGMLTMIITPSSGTVRPVNIRLVVQKAADGDDVVMGASDFPISLYAYMDDWLAENEPTEIANLKSGLLNVFSTEQHSTEIEGDPLYRLISGGISSSAGTNTSAEGRARTPFIPANGKTLVVLDSADYEFLVWEYATSGAANSGTVTPSNGYTNSGFVAFDPTENTTCFRLAFGAVDGHTPLTTDITDETSDYYKIRNALHIYTLTDKSLSVKNGIADSETVGNRINTLVGHLNTEYIYQPTQYLKNDQITSGGNYVITSGHGNRTSSSNHYITSAIKNIMRQRIYNDSSLLIRVHLYEWYQNANTFSYISTTNWLSKGEDAVFSLSSAISGINRIIIEFKKENEDDIAQAEVLAEKDNVLFFTTPAITEKVFADTYICNDDIGVFSSSADVWMYYDILQNRNPQYVTKQTLTSGDFTNYAYTISLGNYNKAGARGTRDESTPRKTILITAGLHGYERSAVSSLLQFTKDLLALAKLEPCLSCDIVILPIGCPSGFDADTRLSANGVNINRNFASSNWTLTESGSQYSGASAGSEDETKAIQNLMDSLLSNTVLYIDIHNSEHVGEISAFLSSDISTPSITYKDVYFHAINKIVSYLKNVRGLVAASYIYGYTTVSANTGTSISYLQEKGIPAYTLELSWNIANTGLHSNFTIGTGAEVIGAIIRQFTNEHPFTPFD